MLVGLPGGCTVFERSQPLATVTIYGESDRADDAWFALVPLADPPEAVGFGADGVACLQGASGSAVVRFDGVPGAGAIVREQVGIVVPEDTGDNVFWVSVAADGSLTSGDGVPVWWQGDPQVC